MAYRLYSTYYKRFLSTKPLETWWDLIGEISRNGYEDSIAHNENDLLVYWRTDWYWDFHNETHITKKVECFTRHIFVYDEYDRIINLNEIRAGIKAYKAPERREYYRHWYRMRGCYFEFRREPVPHTGHSRWGRYYRYKRHTYRNSYLSTCDILPDPRINSQLDLGCKWDDEFPRSNEKNWKSQGKKKHQWER